MEVILFIYIYKVVRIDREECKVRILYRGFLYL